MVLVAERTEKVHLTVRIEPDLLWDLKAAAVQARMTLGDYVDRLLREGLERDRGASR